MEIFFWRISYYISLTIDPHSIDGKIIAQNIKTNIILVDHSKLCEEQLYLSDYVTEIYDHHQEYKYNFKNLKKAHIKYPLGSCTTLILLDYFFDTFPKCLINPLFAITALLIDTNKFEYLVTFKTFDNDRKFDRLGGLKTSKNRVKNIDLNYL